jgi:hypothetical protein
MQAKRYSGILTVVLFLSADWAVAQDYSQEPLYGTFESAPGRPLSQNLAIVAGGEDDVSYLGGNCVGLVAAAPDIRILSGGGNLTISVDSVVDTTLVVNDPNGTWHCVDDVLGINPVLSFGSAMSGQWDVWVGTYGGGYGDAVLSVQMNAAAGNSQSSGRTVDAKDNFIANTPAPSAAPAVVCPSGTVLQNGSCVWQGASPAVECPSGASWNGTTCVWAGVQTAVPAPTPAQAVDTSCIDSCSDRYRRCDRSTETDFGICAGLAGISGVGDAVNRQRGAWNEATEGLQRCTQSRTDGSNLCRQERMSCENRCP